MREPRTPSRRRAPSLLAALGVPGLALLIAAAAAPPAARSAPPAPTPARADTGFVIASEAVVRSCSSCHRQDDQGRMGRISYLRKTPEGWQASLRRMVTLHGARIEPEAAREVVKYLSDAQGLAPEELRPGRFEVERRITPFSFQDADTERTCGACHSMGRVMTQRRTPEEWGLLIATHRALYPLVDRQIFFERSAPERSEENPEGKHPVERAVDYLSRAFPLETPDWRAWAANVRPPRLEGTWALSGREPGRGRVFGTVEIRPVAGSEDEFTTEASYAYADGSSASRSGRSLVYTGYQWRGRSTAPRGAAELREVMLVERGWGEMSGRWYHGAYDEFGMDVTLRRVTGEPVVTGVEPFALRAGAGPRPVRVFGANLPADLAAGSVDLGPGIAVRRVVSASPQGAVLEVEVAADAPAGRRDAFVGGVTLTDALAVYDRVDAIRVSPELGLARVGGIVVPPQGQQFEAIGLHRGPDGRPGTEDDLELGPVPARWRLEEYPVTYEDDDVRFVGRIDERGLFSPAVDGPNPERSGNRNNVGEVWVVATWQDAAAGAAEPLEARAYLVVTVPVHLRWGEEAPPLVPGAP